MKLCFVNFCKQHRVGKECACMAKERFVEVYSQGITNVEKIVVDTETGVNYLLASSTLTAGCGMSILVNNAIPSASDNCALSIRNRR